MNQDAQKIQKRQPTNRVFIWIAITSIFAIVLALQIWRNVEQTKNLQRELQDVQAQQSAANVKQLELQAQVDMLQDDNYVLKLARSRGHYSLPNEIIFNILEENNLLKQEKARRDSTGN
ncbi:MULTISPECIES: septum formation initiator family protein [unclassified Granulicatella]|uniref:FtsB family cell division protein n=1 Tax=unclassified Granulicatella TaxID=2630493 RepID=UPI0010748495|nr:MULTISPECIES: septum formation initiator family protein [unclassified Granulicatella]MBF0780005.1 septum formation initiator family protein [Granulicatella sp. 19428wC4_WM01]TFU95932.1 hypothetical protein E4T68_02750 [Granulicatella sp. WM01]